MAERVLIMTVPCHRASVALVIWPLDTNRAFPEFFAAVGQWPKMVSSGCLFVSSPDPGRNKAGSAQKTRRTPKGFNGRPKI
jgi:hypothetical protein